MKRTIFKILLAMLVIIVLSASVYAANVVRSGQTVYVDGVQKSFDVYNIDGSNYFKLRDIAFVMNNTNAQFGVEYDNVAAAIRVVNGQAYSADDSEMIIGIDKSSTAKISTQQLTVNGEIVALKAYLIGGNNYFKLRELGDTIGFYVSYNDERDSVQIDSISNEYKESDLVVVLNIGGKMFRIAHDSNPAFVSATRGSDYYINAGGVLQLLSCYDGRIQYEQGENPYIGPTVYGEGSKITWSRGDVYYSATEVGNVFSLINNNNGLAYTSESGDRYRTNISVNGLNVIEFKGEAIINSARCLPIKEVLSSLGIACTITLDKANNQLIFKF
ncbi:MAG: hypothetical protein EOM59_08775 [Clostridia bacterium]|nr:hypothetical protein [Clostridia bacterium]